MGEVYRAEDSRLHRDVAIKVLPSHLASDRASLERFRRETRAIAALSHPNILAIFDVGSADGIQYAVTELLEGETLRARLSRGRLEPRDAVDILLEIANGVAAAHARQIVHRDLKPENIFITREGRVKVLDFGLARSSSSLFAARGETGATEVLPTEPGVVLGTVGYLAPEQVEARTPTPAADVFALGCILYELITGKVPFERASAAHAMVALLHDDAPRLQVDGDPLLREIDALVQRCLEKDPHDRPRDAGDLAAELHLLAGGERVSQKYRAPARGRDSRRTWTAAALVLFLLLAAALATFLIARQRSRLIDQGYDLRASDIRGDGETTRLIELALKADAEGNRSKAVELLEEAHRRSSQTPFPAAFLSSFNDAAGNFAEGERWGKLAAARLTGASTYESLLARYLLVPAGDRARELALANSGLDVRPDAWRLRLATAHIYLEQRDREAARRALKLIDVRKPDDRRLMLVLADRGSLGDIEGAERDLRASRLMSKPAMLHYTEGRIAWSRGNARLAGESYDRAASEAAAQDLAPLEAEARVLSGLALIRQGRWTEAQSRLAGATQRARALGLSYRVFDSAAFGAYAAHREGDDVERDRKLEIAKSVGPPNAPTASLVLLSIRIGSQVWETWDLTEIERDPETASSAILIHAREAFARGDLDTAARELRRARAEGIDGTGDREEAELLASDLGLPAQLLPPDPPYPNDLRYLAIFELETRQKDQLRMSIGTGAVR
jgi:hypothetical protein